MCRWLRVTTHKAIQKDATAGAYRVDAESVALQDMWPRPVVTWVAEGHVLGSIQQSPNAMKKRVCASRTDGHTTAAQPPHCKGVRRSWLRG